jgi:hypothetical protein
MASCSVERCPFQKQPRLHDSGRHQLQPSQWVLAIVIVITVFVDRDGKLTLRSKSPSIGSRDWNEEESSHLGVSPPLDVRCEIQLY